MLGTLAGTPSGVSNLTFPTILRPRIQRRCKTSRVGTAEGLTFAL